MTTLWKWMWRAVFLAAALVAVFLVCLDGLAKALVQNRIKSETNLEVQIGDLAIGLVNPMLDIRNITVYNPPEFGGSPLAKIPEVHVEYDPASLWERQLRLRLLRVNLSELTLARNPQGQFISDYVQKQRTVGGHRPEPAAQAPVKFTGIDTLNLSLGKIRFARMDQPGRISERDLAVQNQVFTNVSTKGDAQKIAFMIGLKHADFFLAEAPAFMTEAMNNGGKKGGEIPRQLIDSIKAMFKKPAGT